MHCAVSRWWGRFAIVVGVPSTVAFFAAWVSTSVRQYPLSAWRSPTFDLGYG
jgi:hypothetical protein